MSKSQPPSQPKRQMIINYVPGEECRVAVTEDGALEEFHAERADAVSHVGNIYVGKVVNVEPAIQAAFVDFGLDANGFLHVSDLHPQYFPGEDDDTTERVGKKTPRRDRPPIQECLRRGQEIAVQVLKEGVGTKGPTVTSYLSIPGRFLVMMPQMDRVGVSRKVEDEETRRNMREILDQLDLPDGFGFILRTAGMERTKAELKRDLAYLQRLWKDMEKRWSKGNKPRLLYSESDLLVRALRDMLTTEIDRIVIDDESAMARAAKFLKIVAPRSATHLFRYTGKTPIFHAMGVEEQIRTIHSREVPLPSGGRLVIDETEALVAIDVNSGRMRDAKDAETNAYRTNMEAADEICRQLRLRDLGGIVINDLIDMRSMKHRRELEARFKENLKRDRARTTLETISEFGILEMTRQRMRASHESVHFADCPICRGRGLVQKPDSVAADAMRELATLLEYDRIARIEMVVGPRIAGELLSTKRRSLNRLERVSGKHVDVRVSEAIPVDRVTFYAYDERGADIDTTRLTVPAAREDQLVPYAISDTPDENWAVDPEQETKDTAAQEQPEHEPEVPIPETFLDTIEEGDEAGWVRSAADAQPALEGPGKRRRRRRGRGRDRAPDAPGQERRQEPQPVSQGSENGAHPPDRSRDEQAAQESQEPGEGGRRRRRRRRRRGGGAREDAGAAPAGGTEVPPGAPPIVPPTDIGSSWDIEPELVQPLPGGVDNGVQPPSEHWPAAGSPDPEPAQTPPAGDEQEQADGTGRRGRRRRRGRSGRGTGDNSLPQSPQDASAHHSNNGQAAGPSSHDDVPPVGATAEGPVAAPDPESTGAGDQPRGRSRRRRRGRGNRSGAETSAPPPQSSGAPPRDASTRDQGSGRGGRAGRPDSARGSQGSVPAPPPTAKPSAGSPDVKPPKRTLYATRRKLLPSERFKAKPE